MKYNFKSLLYIFLFERAFKIGSFISLLIIKLINSIRKIVGKTKEIVVTKSIFILINFSTKFTFRCKKLIIYKYYQFIQYIGIII